MDGHCVSHDNHCYSVVDLKQYPLAQSAPFSKSATTSSFQIEKILKLKTDSFLERLQLSFPAGENMKAGENVQKIAVKSGVHTENDRFFRMFEFKKTVFKLPYIPQSKAFSKMPRVKVKIITSEKQKSMFY